MWREGLWVGQKKQSKDPGLRMAHADEVTHLLRNADRVLLRRGMKGTKVFCLDQKTREHLVKATASVMERCRVRCWFNWSETQSSQNTCRVSGLVST